MRENSDVSYHGPVRDYFLCTNFKNMATSGTFGVRGEHWARLLNHGLEEGACNIVPCGHKGWKLDLNVRRRGFLVVVVMASDMIG